MDSVSSHEETMLWKPFRQTFRRLLKTPLFTTVAIATLALGIGANTAIFNLVNGILINPLPYPDSDRLVRLWHTAPGMKLPQFEQSEGTYLAYLEHCHFFGAMAASDFSWSKEASHC